MTVELLHGDCLALMQARDPASVDAVVCDPPYGIGFMGKEWDTFAPANVEEAKKRDTRSAARRELYGSRSSAAPSAAMAAARYDRSPAAAAFGEWCSRWAAAALRVAKPGAHLVCFGGPRSFHRMAVGIEDAGWEIRDGLSWLYGSGFPKSRNGAWGGTALKPAWEPIILARKPLIGTVEANVAAHGTGALNIEGCRIEGAKAGGSGAPPLRFAGENARPFHATAEPTGKDFDTSLGRWPANVALDEEAAAMLDRQSGERQAGGNLNGTEPSRPAKNTYGEYNDRREWQGYGDAGGASRFFYCAKASRAERDAGLDGVEKKPLNWSSGEQSPTFQSPNTERAARNHHPTVKPVSLMRWLVRLVTPVGGLVLDPFMGSGTTGIACALEGFGFVGMEREAEYLEIARRRIAHAAAQPSLFTVA